MFVQSFRQDVVAMPQIIHFIDTEIFWNASFYGLAVMTGSIALQKFFFFFFDIKVFFFGSSFFSTSASKNLMGHAVLNFSIFLQVFE